MQPDVCVIDTRIARSWEPTTRRRGEVRLRPPPKHVPTATAQTAEATALSRRPRVRQRNLSLRSFMFGTRCSYAGAWGNVTGHDLLVFGRQSSIGIRHFSSQWARKKKGKTNHWRTELGLEHGHPYFHSIIIGHKVLYLPT